MLPNKTRKWIYQISLGLTLVLFTMTGAVQATKSPLPLEPERSQMVQTVKIIKALERYHYTGKKLDNDMSIHIFDRYVKQLDPSRRLLTLADLRTFAPYRERFDTDLKMGNLKVTFAIFNLYQQRAGQRLNYILKTLDSWQTHLDLESENNLIVDFENRPRAKDISALEGYWEKDLTNHIIGLKLDEKPNDEITETLRKIYGNRLSRLSQTNASDVFQLFINTVTECFDPHTQYFPPRASEDFDIHMSLSLEGIGAVLSSEYEYTKVVRLIPKGPADKSNKLMPGDKIIGVGQGKDGEITDIIGQRIDEVVKLIRGPKDSHVRLKIIPAKKSNSTATISIKRDKVKLEEQAAKKEVVTLNQGGRQLKIGIIEIPNFYIDFQAFHRGDKNYKSTTSDVKKLLKELRAENIDGLIIDLRDNGGGSLKEANELTGLFLKSGPTVQIKTKHRVSRLYDNDLSIAYTGPLAVLINRMSASASEIFAGAIKDYNRGIIIGTRSFGKGTVQELGPLGDGKLKLTSAKFYRVSGESTQHQGVLPDISMPGIYKMEDTGESSLDGALLWDTIPRSHFLAYPTLDSVFPSLKESLAKRSRTAPGIIYLKKRLQMIEDLDREAALSLNLKERIQKKERDADQELEIENDYLAAIGEPLLDEYDNETAKIKEYKKIILKQTQFVMADFISLSQTQGFSW
ncbi:MAG: carboxy terminal-processing peptidase [Desulfobacterales bacterium]|nr:carboxy terminal-processing peptidase [Desulfobacterales bacterium]